MYRHQIEASAREVQKDVDHHVKERDFHQERADYYTAKLNTLREQWLLAEEDPFTANWRPGSVDPSAVRAEAQAANKAVQEEARQMMAQLNGDDLDRAIAEFGETGRCEVTETPEDLADLEAVQAEVERQLAARASNVHPLRDPFAEPPRPVTEPGMYETPDGRIYKVQKSQTSGALYAKLLVEIEGTARPYFSYAPGEIKNLTAAMRMTTERAAARGRAIGCCVVCGALLTDPVSVANGIGPICGGRV